MNDSGSDASQTLEQRLGGWPGRPGWRRRPRGRRALEIRRWSSLGVL